MKEIVASTDVPIEYMQASVRKQVFHSKEAGFPQQGSRFSTARMYVPES